MKKRLFNGSKITKELFKLDKVNKHFNFFITSEMQVIEVINRDIILKLNNKSPYHKQIKKYRKGLNK